MTDDLRQIRCAWRRCIRLVLAMVCAMGFAVGAAHAQDSIAAAAVEGAWIVSVGEETRERFLIVRGATVDRNEITVKRAVYGWLDSKGAVVRDWRAEIFGDTINVSFLTPADSRVQVSFAAAETTVSGQIEYKSGKKHVVRMTRIDEAELAALRASLGVAQAAPRKLGLTKDSRIALMYVGAFDCPSCRMFVAKYGHDNKLLKEVMPELTEARYVFIQLATYKGKLTAGSLPEELRWLMQPAADGKSPLRKRGVPFFAAVVDQRVLAQGHGVVGLEKIVAPAIKRAVEERRAMQ